MFVDLSNIKIGDKVKTELRPINCAGEEINNNVSFKGRWKILEFTNNIVVLENNKGETLTCDRKTGKSLPPNPNHWIYKLL